MVAIVWLPQLGILLMLKLAIIGGVVNERGYVSHYIEQTIKAIHMMSTVLCLDIIKCLLHKFIQLLYCRIIHVEYLLAILHQRLQEQYKYFH